jgi:hypothetical protein
MLAVLDGNRIGHGDLVVLLAFLKSNHRLLSGNDNKRGYLRARHLQLNASITEELLPVHKNVEVL